jgi:DMSO reductase family type II enzyme heme b subunit
MKVSRTKVSSSLLLDPRSSVWDKAGSEAINLIPTPLPIAREVSPFMALSDDHGKVAKLQVSALHNGRDIAFRLKWNSKEKNEIQNLDQFADAAAIMFAMSDDASAITMGSKGKPVNSWLWRAGHDDPADVLAEGFGTSIRRKSSESELKTTSDYGNGWWSVILERPLHAGRGFVQMAAGGRSRVAFAVWEGSNDERAGRKSFSGEFIDMELEA